MAQLYLRNFTSLEELDKAAMKMKQFHGERLCFADPEYPGMRDLHLGSQLEELVHHGARISSHGRERFEQIKDHFSQHSLWNEPDSGKESDWRLWLGILAESLLDDRLLMVTETVLKSMHGELNRFQDRLNQVSNWYRAVYVFQLTKGVAHG